MHGIRSIILILILISSVNAQEYIKETSNMSVSGSFEVTLEPQVDEGSPAGRMLISKQYSGALNGWGKGQMLSKRTEKGASVYAAIEEFTGTIDGKKGGFSLFHTGFMSQSSQELKVIVIEGSGSGELTGITGQLFIYQEGGAHHYRFEFHL